jgi:hypothetical protein
MKLSSRLFSKALKTTLVLGASLLATAMGGTQAKAADMYGFPNLNGKTVYLELANGQRVQLPLARAVNGNKVNSFTADNTDDWKWKVVDDGFGVSFLRVNTNQAFSVENLNVVDRTPIVSWDYQGHGRYLDWNPEAVGGGYYLIRLRHNLNQCLNIPGGANNVWVTTWTCNANDPDQRFKIVDISTISANPPGTTPLPTSQTIVSNTTPLYEYWIVARKKADWSLTSFKQGGDTGHAFGAIIRKDQENVKVYTNGSLTQNYNRDKGNWYRFHTYGFYTEGLATDVCSAGYAGNDDCLNMNSILAGNGIPNTNWAARKARVSESRANWMHQNKNVSGCQRYNLAGDITYANSPMCNCVDYITRQWLNFSSQQENFVPGVSVYWSANPLQFLAGSTALSLWNQSPNVLVDRINSRNSSVGPFLDNGNTWQ